MVDVRYRGRRTTLQAPLRQASGYVNGELIGTPAACGIAEAAKMLGCSVTSVRRYIHAGCPVVRHGTRGRGKATLIDPAAIHAWRTRRGSDVRRLADHLPDRLGRAFYGAFVKSTTPSVDPYGQSIYARRADVIPAGIRATMFADLWVVATTAALDCLREIDRDVPRLKGTPSSVRALREIASK